MTKCPKCGSHWIQGPFYRPPVLLFKECLLYRCACGYTETKPTLDSKRPPEPVR